MHVSLLNEAYHRAVTAVPVCIVHFLHSCPHLTSVLAYRSSVKTVSTNQSINHLFIKQLTNGNR